MSPPPVMPNEAKDALQAVFKHFDKDGGGKISANELVMSGLLEPRHSAYCRLGS